MSDSENKRSIKDRLTVEGRMQLRHGPYHSPAAGIGDTLYCEIFGEVKIVKWGRGKITWPRASGVGSPYVLCGDLIRAVRVESHQAIMYYWGVSCHTVTTWRKALGTPRFNEGTRQLQSESINLKITPEMKARGSARIREADVQAKTQHTLSARELRPKQRGWTPEEDRMLGTIPDRKLANHFGCAIATVEARRRLLGIAPTRVGASWRIGPTTRQMQPAVLHPLRVALGRTQKEIAQAMGVGRGHYARLERGEIQIITLKTLERLSAALRCDPSQLVQPYPETPTRRLTDSGPQTDE